MFTHLVGRHHTLLGELLLGELDLLGVPSFGRLVFLLTDEQLDVTGGGHVPVDAAVGAVGAAAALTSALGLDVRHDLEGKLVI